jgi:hypothetical protein
MVSGASNIWCPAYSFFSFLNQKQRKNVKRMRTRLKIK